MNMLSFTEENYIKAIYRLSNGGAQSVATNDIAEHLCTKAASVTDMIKKLSNKALISYEPYYGANVTRQGKAHALMIIRRHRLWETFLVNKLNFSWDEVHDVAEQLEHIQSPLLVEKLDEFLGFPNADPHGHPIPDKNGKIHSVSQIALSILNKGKRTFVRSVTDGSASYLQYLSKIGIYIGAAIEVVEKIDYDGSLEIIIDDNKKVFISKDAAKNLLVEEV